MSDDDFDEKAYREYEDELYHLDSRTDDSDVDSEIADAAYAEVHYATELNIPQTLPNCDTDDNQHLNSNNQKVVQSVDSLNSSRKKNDKLYDQLLGGVGSSEEQQQADDFIVIDDVDNWSIVECNTGVPSSPDTCIENSDGEIFSETSPSLESGDNSATVSNEENWTLDEKDLNVNQEKKKKTVSRYYIPTSAKLQHIRCFNCNERGHIKNECPQPVKPDVCILCGLIGHLNWKCPNDLCYNCSEPGHQSKVCRKPRKRPYDSCRRCFVNGHLERECPDLWRRFHRTTQTGGVTRPGSPFSPTGPIYCYNCSNKGHYGHECPDDPMDNRVIPTFPFIVRYSSSFTSRKRSAGKESDKKNQVNNFDSSKRRHSTPSHRVYNHDSRHVRKERIIQVVSHGKRHKDEKKEKNGHEEKESKTSRRDWRHNNDNRDRKSDRDNCDVELTFHRKDDRNPRKAKGKKKKRKIAVETSPDELRNDRVIQMLDDSWHTRSPNESLTHKRKRRRDEFHRQNAHAQNGDDGFQRTPHKDDWRRSVSNTDCSFISDRGFRFEGERKTNRHKNKRKHKHKCFTH